MYIRRAENRDTGTIMRLLHQVLDIHHAGRPDIFKAGVSKYTESELREIITDERRPIFVAECDTGVIGYAFCIIKETKGDNILHDMKALYIDDLCIDESARGLGVGRALYEHTLDYARSISCSSLTLNVWECNSGAKEFYEKMGLKPQKTVMEKLL